MTEMCSMMCGGSICLRFDFHVCVCVCVCCVCVCFFLQAEDGIRDLVRSRGLGDVYKRQGLAGVSTHTSLVLPGWMAACTTAGSVMSISSIFSPHWVATVSYTHLTLPTSELV